MLEQKSLWRQTIFLVKNILLKCNAIYLVLAINVKICSRMCIQTYWKRGYLHLSTMFFKSVSDSSSEKSVSEEEWATDVLQAKTILFEKQKSCLKQTHFL